MANLRILVPEGTDNYIQNPSARYDTTGWTNYLSTLTRTLDRARFGIASFKVVTFGAVLGEGIFYRVSNLSGISDNITVSTYLCGNGTVRIRLIDNPFGKEYAGQPVVLRDDRWTRVEVTGRSTGSNDLRLYIETVKVKAVTFYVDGVQMERKPYSTTYADGDQEGCHWNIMAHASRSTREPYSRSGGRWVELAGPERIEKNLYMTVVGGMGLPPITNNLQSFADAPGSYYQNTKVMARPIALTFHAMHEARTQKCSPASLAALHELRQMLIDVIKPDKTAGGEEFLLEYTDGDKPLYLKARYDGGLEGDWDVRNEWINSFPLRLLAVSPYYFEADQRVSSLDFQESPGANNVLSRVNGSWGIMNYGVDGIVERFALGKQGEIIAVGQFSLANNNAGAITPNIAVGGITYWDGEKWNRYGNGANDIIYNVAVAPNGYVYVCGAFTAIGGVAANKVAYWNGSAWNAMGSGLNDDGVGIAVAPNGDVYVVGHFTAAGGVTAGYIARWDGSSWHAVGTAGGLNAASYTLAISPDGESLYVGGSFSDVYGSPGSSMLRIAKLDIATNAFEAMGDGLNDIVRTLKISPSGRLYAGGDFVTSGAQSIKNVAYWNGSTWVGLGMGMDGFISVSTRVFGIDINSNAELIAVGDFTEAGQVEAGGVAIWNGSVWTNLDTQITQYITAVIYDKKGNIYLGADTPLQVGGVTLVTNIGTAETNPVLYVRGQATLKFLENYTTKKRVYFDLDILSGEEVFIDFGRGRVESTIRGDLSYAVLPGSDLRAFTLLPGENKIIALMVNDVGGLMYLSYTPRHWSADATQSAEAL
jgi:hypothetical protein